jgi:hypothetical protein
MKAGFIYIWRDRKNGMFYIGSHLGSETDGYIGSGTYFISAYKSRPNDFSRRIIEKNILKQNLLERENYWLSFIKPKELRNRYYNLKNVAAGGDIFSNLPDERKNEILNKCSQASLKYWDNISEDEYKNRQQIAFGGNLFDRSYMIKRNKELCSKIAKIVDPNGNKHLIKNISEFCETHNINYGNLKSVLRGERRSCQGYRGKYINEAV